MLRKVSEVARSYLTLGWQVTPTLDPRYWLDHGAKPGGQRDEDLVRVPADSLGAHAAIIAQSGSGKSFFLGRLVEEICMETRARCLVLDPNADFCKVHHVEDGTLWSHAAYDMRKRRGRLPHEARRAEFLGRWRRLALRIHTGRRGPYKQFERLQLWWPSVAPEFLAENVEPMLRSDFYHCHAFVRAIAEPVTLKQGVSDEEKTDVLDVAERLLAKGQTTRAEFISHLEHEFDTNMLLKAEKARLKQLGVFTGAEIQSMAVNRVERLTKRAAAATAYVSPEVERFYFGKAREYQAAGILRQSPKEAHENSEAIRLEVIDLPSLPDKGTRLLAINSVLATHWDKARGSWARALRRDPESDTRVPTFIVVDEAHNLIPAEAHGKAEIALREQFRTIVAEGRKYGLFLILASQRPDKLDPLVLSECENKVVMRLGSGSVLAITQKMLGLDDVPPKLLEKCLEFETGRALLIGPWAPAGPQLLYAAARRTVEGGRNLREAYWATPDDGTLAK